MNRYSVKEFAKAMNVHEQTVRWWLTQGKIKPAYREKNRIYFTEEQRIEMQEAYMFENEGKRLYRIGEFAEALNVHEQTVRVWLAKGEIKPVSRIKKAYVFSEEQLEEWQVRLQEKKEQRYVRIGIFSEQVGVRVTNLQMYANLGIFPPAKTLKEGTRYYKISQIADFQQFKEEPKYAEILKEEYYTQQELRQRYQVTMYEMKKRISELAITPVYEGKNGQYFFTSQQVEELDNYNQHIQQNPEEYDRGLRMTPSAFSQHIGRRRSTVKVWDYAGILPARKRGKKQLRYYTKNEVEKYYAMQADEEQSKRLQEEYYNTQELADKLGVSTKTLRTWFKNKQLVPEYHQNQGGMYYSEMQYRQGLSYLPKKEEAIDSQLVSDLTVAKIVGKSVAMLNRWQMEGFLEPDKVTEQDEKYYDRTKIQQQIIGTDHDQRKTLGYLRLSNTLTMDSAYMNQLNYLHYRSKLGQNYTLVIDNEDRMAQQKKNLQHILEQIQNYEIAQVVVCTKKDLEPIGYHTFTRICSEHFTTIRYIKRND